MIEYYYLIVLIGVLIFRVWCHGSDKQRIAAHCQRLGMRVHSIAWTPFAEGWLFENGERQYEVRYSKDNKSYTARCKTGLLTGVFLGETRSL